MIATGVVADPGDRVPFRFRGKALIGRLSSNDGNAVMYTVPAAGENRLVPLDLEDGYPMVPDQSGIDGYVEESVVERYTFVPGPWGRFSASSARPRH